MKQLGLSIGVVKNNADPAHHGRLQVFVPAYDSNDYKVEDLPWAFQITPFGGVTAKPVVGREGLEVPGLSSYGTWAIPKNGAQVLIGCLDGNPEMRFWLGCVYMPEYNRTIPGFVDGLMTELDDTGNHPQQEVEMLKLNLTDAGLYKGEKHFESRGGYERSISHPSNKNKVKPTDNGYAKNPNDPEKADSQVVTTRSYGGHYMLMSDVDEHCRIRFKTTAGNQVIFDDTNERIYLSTAKGRNWVELDETNGKIYVFSDSKVSIRARNDINLFSDENINIVAKHRVNIQSLERGLSFQAKSSITALSTGGNINLTASRDLNLKTTNGAKEAAHQEENLSEPAGWHQSSPVSVGKIYRWAEEAGSETSHIKFNSAKNIEALATEKLKLTAKKALELKSSEQVMLQAARTVTTKAPKLKFDTDNASDSMGCFALEGIQRHRVYSDGGVDTINAVEPIQPVEAQDVDSTMVKPDHESWTRDEDEGSCATNRGPKYQG